MVDLLRLLLDGSDFPARWNCGNWTALHGYVHIISDLGTWGAYTAIPIVIAYFTMRRRDMPFPALFWVFGAFIFFCGSVHLMDAVLFYWPAYRLSGLLKLGTALASWAAVVALARVVPVALKYPGLESLNADLLRANRNLDEFAYVVSHDLKAPLRAIRSLAEWIGEDAKELNETSRADLQLLLGRTVRMEQLINGILRYSKVGRQTVPFRSMNADRVARQAIDDLALPQNAIVDIPDQLPVIMYDETMFQQVIQNLVENAVKYGDKPRTVVRITAKDTARFWEFRVADNGRGIGKEHYERIFRVFQSLSPRDGEDATGIGLAIVKKIVETSGGRVSVESTVGEGSTFTFTIAKPQASR
jgi:light-regulated signal transduction histidine kinase (bacteriophytochrome)